MHYFKRKRFEGKSIFSEALDIKDFFLEYESTLVCNQFQKFPSQRLKPITFAYLSFLMRLEVFQRHLIFKDFFLEYESTLVFNAI